MSILDLHADELNTRAQNTRFVPQPKPPTSKFNGWATTTAVPRGAASGAAESAGFWSDVLGAFGQAYATTEPARPMFGSDPRPKETADARKQLLEKGLDFSSDTGDIFREVARSYRPNPQEAHLSESLLFDLSRFATKAVGYSAAGGPAFGATFTAADEAFAVSDELKRQGVDLSTRTKAGAVQGAAAGLGVLLPVAGKTWLQTAGLVAVGGPGSFMAAQAVTREVLKDADYSKVADQYDPLDPVGLAVSTLVPAGFGAYGMRRARRAPPEVSPPDNEPRFVAMRVGTNEGLASRNAGNAQGVADFLARADDPMSSVGAAKGSYLYVYEIKQPGEFGAYEPLGGGTPAQHTAVGRRDNKGAEWYSFPASQAGERVVTKIPMEDVRAELKARGFEDFDDSGSIQGAAAIQAVIDRALGKAVPPVEAVDAAMVQHQQTARAAASLARPGDLAGQAKHEAALTKAEDQIARGERVNVSDEVPAGDFAVIEARLRNKIADDFEGTVKEYSALEDSKGGKVLNTDTARELSPDYLRDRTRSAAVHEPASQFIKDLYARKLAEQPKGDELPLVMFTAGGTGAGKTSAIQQIPGIAALADNAQIVYDTNMNTYASSKAKVEQALAAGKEVAIVMVARDPVDALVHGALPRAENQIKKYGSGRTVPIEEHIKTHIGAADTVNRLAHDYKDDPRVAVTVVDNSLGKGRAAVRDPSFLEGLRYNDVEQRVRAALEQEREAGRISADTYAGFAGRADAGGASKAERVQAEHRPVDGRGAEQEPSGTAEKVAQAEKASATARLDELELASPDLLVQMDGMAKPQRLADFIAAVKKEAAEMRADAPDLEVAANCLLTAGL